MLKPKVRESDVLLDRCYDDAELDAARDVVADASRPTTERASTALRVVAGRRGDTERQLLAQEVLAEAGHDLAEELQRQVVGTGLADDDLADATGLAAATLVSGAWAVRGRGTVDTVGPDAARLFLGMLETADDLALEGLRVVPDHPGCALARLTAGRGRGVPTDDLLHRFEVARRREPLSVPAHLQALQGVCQKWLGSHEAMFDLVGQTLAAAPPGHPATMVLPVAHMEYHAAGERDALARRRQDLPYIRNLSTALLAADDSHPRALEAHSAFGWYFASIDDKQPAREHLLRAWLRPSWLWRYLDGETPQVYCAVLKEVGAAR